MEYRNPVDEAQLRHVAGTLRSFKRFVEATTIDFPPRNAEARRRLRRLRESVRALAAAAAARDGRAMKYWFEKSDADLWSYYWFTRR
jgi:hypothetical protein